MKASRYIIFLYAAMLGVPLLFVLNLAATASGYFTVSRIIEALIAVGLLVYCTLGYMEIYGSRFEKPAAVATLRLDSSARGAQPERTGERERQVEISLKRFSPSSKALEAERYKVNANKFTTVLDGLIAIKSEQDSSLAVRYSCRMGICGSCGMVINGRPSLACQTSLFDVEKEGAVEVQPMQAHPLLKDLVTDFDDFFEKHASVEPQLYRTNKKEQAAAKSVYKQSKAQLHEYLPYSYCIMCGLCNDACPVVNSNPKFIGPQALSQAYRYHKDSRDQMGGKRLNIIDSLDSVWGCEFAGACSEVCPKGVDPAASIQALKFGIFEEYLPGGKE